MPPRGPYKRRLACLQEDGPDVIVALCARAQGVRWQPEFARVSAQQALSYLNRRLGRLHLPAVGDWLAGAQEMWCWVGLAVVASWRLATTRGNIISRHNTTDETSELDVMRNVLFGHACLPKRPLAVVEYPIHDAVWMEQDIGLAAISELDDPSVILESPFMSQRLWASLQHGEAQVLHHCRPGEEPRPRLVKDVLQQWHGEYGIAMPSNQIPHIVGWRTWSPLAALMTRKSWCADITIVSKRLRGIGGLRLRADAPPQKKLMQYLSQELSS